MRDIVRKENIKKYTLKIEESEDESSINEVAEQVNDVEEPIQEQPKELTKEDRNSIYREVRNRLNTRLSKMRRVICIPDSILLKVQTQELQNCLIGQLARIFCLYKINEIIIIHDHSYTKKVMGVEPAVLIQKVLQYLETPQYLRKRLFPISNELKFAGLIAPLECHHHLKREELLQYREGVVLKRPTKEKSGSWVDVGLWKDCKIDRKIQPDVRVTVAVENFQAKSPKCKLTSLYRKSGIAQRTRNHTQPVLGVQRMGGQNLLGDLQEPLRELPQGAHRQRPRR